ncbi:INO80 complex subunit C-like [Liolophura sinensis]|uniref:INO80 complex subunit C-like n=1 Tax=Liolophura sinensis TaxID=3198878 RepID=UPI00315941F0
MASTIKSRAKNSRSRTSSPALGNQNSKKKRPNTPSSVTEGDSPVVTTELPASPAVTEAERAPPPVFKDPNFLHSTKGAAGNKKTRIWKNLKQIIAAERSLPWKPDDATYGTIDAPPSFKPAKKYSDLTGLPAKYRDPHTKIRYASPEEFARISYLPSDMVTGYLALRKANLPVP